MTFRCVNLIGSEIYIEFYHGIWHIVTKGGFQYDNEQRTYVLA